MLEEGVVYSGKVDDYKVISFNTKNGPGFALKLWVKPDDNSYFRTNAFDWIGMDEDGPFIYKDSKMKTWLCRIFGTEDLSKVIIELVKGKRCQFLVKNEIKDLKDKEGKTVKRKTADVVEILPPLPLTATVQPATSAQQVPQPVGVSTAPPPQPAPKPKASDNWDDGEVL